ncbi:hypothetical protein COLO4_36016 [Corchorus olitorius]|uniref:Protein kinase domain-containing protein n=1 Tax=Corchorus olitorius TaxID=93759 RepID=A0A1R3GBA2_9ROSI|nr:hypothetical protein COLO4_36016 [Corchorus olitorius]
MATEQSATEDVKIDLFVDNDKMEEVEIDEGSSYTYSSSHSHGELETDITGSKNMKRPFPRLRGISTTTSIGKYFVLQHIRHVDLKLDDTLLNGRVAPRVKICDFGSKEYVDVWMMQTGVI